MTRLFTSGLESGSLATEGLVATGAAAIATDRFNQGARSLKTTGVDAMVTRTQAGTSPRSYYVRAYVNIDVSPTGGPAPSGQRCQVFQFHAGAASATVLINASLGIGIEASGGFSTRRTANGLVGLDTWHLVEARIMVNTGGNDEIEVRLDGATVLSTESAAWATSNLGSVEYGNNYDYSGAAWFDDLAINSDQGASDNSWIGPLGVVESGAVALAGVGSLTASASVTSPVVVSPARVVRELPPLRVSFDIETPNGRHYRWADDEVDPSRVPGGARFSDTMPGGFENLDATLPRKTQIDYGDIEPLSTIRVHGASLDVAGEYRLERAPRSSGNEIAISPSAVGWQAHLEDNKQFSQLYVDRDLGRWKGAGEARRAATPITATINDPSVVSEQGGTPALFMSATTPWTPIPALDAFYEAGSDARAQGISFDWALNPYGATASPLSVTSASTYGTNDEVGFTEAAEFQGSAVAGSVDRTFVASYRELMVEAIYNAANATDGNEWGIFLRNVAVRGDHSLTWRGTAADGGYYASDMIRHAIAAGAPLIATSDESVEQSSFVVVQAAYVDPTTVGEVVRDLVKYGLQDWAVWEGPLFHFHTRGARGRRWRTRVRPAQLEETGPQVDRLWDSVVVAYQDVGGGTRTVGPPGSGAMVESAALQDVDPDNPAVRLGATRRQMLTMGVSNSTQAIEVGQRFLQEARLLDTSGRVTLTGYVADDRGVMHPYHRVRSGDYLAVVDANDPSYRRIVRTDKDTASRSCNADLDSPPEGLQQLLERYGAGLVRLGL